MALKIRRGTESQRGGQTFAAGEIIWTTNGHKLYVGDGVTPGGIDAASQLGGIGLTYNTGSGKLDLNLGSTTSDTLTEGNNNLYHTVNRAIAAAGAGLVDGNAFNTGVTFTYDDVNHRITAAVSASSSLPSQSGQNGKFLTTNGASATWAVVTTDLSSDTSPALGGNLDITGYDITGTGNLTITGDLTIGGGVLFETDLGGAANADFLTIRTHHNDVDAAGAFFYRSKGTTASPTSLASGDAIFNLGFSGRSSDGSDSIGVALAVDVGGTVGAGKIPGKFSVYTTGNDGSFTAKLAVGPDGQQTLVAPALVAGSNPGEVNTGSVPTYMKVTFNGVDYAVPMYAIRT